MTTYAVLQKLPPEALDGDEGRYGAVDVLAVGTQLGAETFLEDYRRRHQAACQEWAAWDTDRSREWDSTFDYTHDEICERYGVTTLIEGVAFEIVPVGAS
jgi:hypothetical protein